MSAAELAELILIEHVPFSAGYLTDLAFTRANIEKCQNLMHGTTLLLCEATFADDDIARAIAKKHLTARQAALFAAAACAQKLDIHHVSGIYGTETSKVCDEAMAFFDSYRQMSPTQIAGAIDAELDRIQKMRA